jgi:CheY-like chemotaxis protein
MAGELILIVEDEEKNLKLMRDALLLEGYRVIEARTGEEGVLAAAQNHPDLILMDYHLNKVRPSIDGVEAFHRIREKPECKDIVVIAVTASAFPEHRAKVQLAGFDGIQTKPLDLDEFVGTVGNALALRKAK